LETNFKSQRLRANGGIGMKCPAMFVFLLGILLLCKIPGASAQTQFVEAGVERFRVPVEAPDFTLQQVGGGKVSLKELRGKIILLNFFASW
jgi:cytochrome oxidase Cu insertion factor (SCO1/SenC/PrrC family)